jgi:hypothetical protein
MACIYLLTGTKVHILTSEALRASGETGERRRHGLRFASARQAAEVQAICRHASLPEVQAICRHACSVSQACVQAICRHASLPEVHPKDACRRSAGMCQGCVYVSAGMCRCQRCIPNVAPALELTCGCW